jgi:hypothetical protein
MAMDASPPSPPFTLSSRRLGALPVISQIAGRMGLPRLLDKHMPLPDVRMRPTRSSVRNSASPSARPSRRAS